MNKPIFRQFILVALAAAAVASPGCRSLDMGSQDDVTGVPLPKRDQAASFFGPGSERVDRDRFEHVAFEGGSAIPRAEEARKLRPVASFMKENPSARVILAGFCDEGQTDEYARSLGERRALSVRALLSDQGVAPERLHTVSYGEDFPAGNRVEIGLIK